MKIILLTLTYLVGAGELILAIYFWVNNSKSEIRRVMSLFALTTSLWVLTSAFDAYQPQTIITTFDTNLIFISAVLSMSFLMHLAVIYPYPMYKFDRLHKTLFYLPASLFGIAAFIPKLIYTGFTGGADNSGVVYPGPLYSLYNFYVLILFATITGILFYRRRKLDGQHKKNMTILAWSIFFGGLPAVVMDILIPFFSPSSLPNTLYANVATVIWLGATTYIIMRK